MRVIVQKHSHRMFADVRGPLSWGITPLVVSLKQLLTYYYDY